MQVDIVQGPQLNNVLVQLPRNPLTGILFGGDRYACIEWAAVVFDEEKLIGITTVAPQGEQNSGIPTIVGVYVLPEYQRRGYGKSMLQRAIQVCVERNLVPLHVDALSTSMMRLIESLDEKERSLLQITDHKGFMDIWSGI